MSRNVTLHFHKGLNSLVIVVSSGLQVFLVENDIFGWACLQATCFLEKGRDKAEQDIQI
jgi:hypothetical protein